MVLYADDESFTLMTPYRFWNHTLANVAEHFGADGAEVDTQVVCVDKRRQWSQWRNVWHSSAIRSTVYTLGAPFRSLKGVLGRA